MPDAAPASSRFPAARTRGSVILLVLVTILLAAFMVTKFVQRAGTELLADARAGDQARMRRTAYSALEATLAVLADIRAADQGLFSPAQGWDKPLEYAGYEPEGGQTVEVEFEDESGRLSLPRADAPTLASLFVVLGLNKNDAEKASEAFLVWTHADYVAPNLDVDASHYERATIPHHPAGRPLKSINELASVVILRDLFFEKDGQPNERLRQFAAAVSLQAFDKVNLNAASPAALEALGLDRSQIDTLQDHLHPKRSNAKPTYFQGITDATPLLGANAPMDHLGVQIQVLRINITVHNGGNLYRLSAVVSPPGSNAGNTSANSGSNPNPSANPAESAAKSESATVSVKKLDYPFKVLELSEDVESFPTSSEPPVES